MPANDFLDACMICLLMTAMTLAACHVHRMPSDVRNAEFWQYPDVMQSIRTQVTHK